MPFYRWLRLLALDRLADAHRRHVRAGRRSVTREEAEPLGLPGGSALRLADQLLANGVCPSEACRREELRERVRAALDSLGPNNSGRRRQFLKRLIAFADWSGLELRLVYYPPYHSKYNPIERCWSALEQKWGGALLNGLKVILQQALRMTWCGQHPTVRRLEGDYPNRVTVSNQEWKAYEARLERSKSLPKYDLVIKPKESDRQVN
jgi:hypothetical protein